MAFKKAQPKRSVPDSPDELLRDLPRRKIPDVLPHQREIMRSYAETALELARYQSADKSEAAEDTALMAQIENVEGILAHLGTVHDRSFAMREKEILEGLESEDNFEQAHKLLGEMVGFDAHKVEEEGSPDPWWIVEDVCLVFEDHAGAKNSSSIDVKKARQVSSHPGWMSANVPASKQAKILPVLVTPVKKVHAKAVAHLDGVALWPLEELKKWAQTALATLRELRKTFVEPGDLDWRERASELFEENNLSARPLFEKLKSTPAVKHLTPE